MYLCIWRIDISSCNWCCKILLWIRILLWALRYCYYIFLNFILFVMNFLIWTQVWIIQTSILNSNIFVWFMFVLEPSILCNCLWVKDSLVLLLKFESPNFGFEQRSCWNLLQNLWWPSSNSSPSSYLNHFVISKQKFGISPHFSNACYSIVQILNLHLSCPTSLGCYTLALMAAIYPLFLFNMLNTH